jgi:similar to stage IV sporulation protein
LRLIKGSVHFCASGGFAERFVSACRAAGIWLWDVEKRRGVLYARCFAGDYRRLRRPARQSGMLLRACRKRGLPFVLLRNKKHLGLAVGCVLFALLMAFLSTRVWVIRLEGKLQTPEGEILRALEEHGVGQGMKAGDLDSRAVAAELLRELPLLDFIALNLRGSELEVLIREHPPDSRVKEDETPADIVAARDGSLVEMRVYAGTRAVTEGSAVVKGDVLIFGYTKNSDGSTSPLRAKGYIVAQTEYTLSASQALEGGLQRGAGRKKQYALRLFGLRLPLYFRAAEANESVRYLCAAGTVLPLGLEVRSSPPQGKPQALTEAQAALLALQELHDTAADLTEFKQLRNQSTRLTSENGSVTVSASYVLWENICRRAGG